MPRGVYDRSKVKRGLDQPAGNIRRRRRRWDSEQVKIIAARWVVLRLENPTEYPMKLLAKAQDVLPESARRKIGTWSMARDVAKEVGVQWAAFVDSATAPKKEPMPPQVQTVGIEVVRKLTKAEMLQLLSEPDLEGLLAAKRLQRENNFHEIMRGIAVHAGAKDLPEVRRFVPQAEPFEPPSKNPARIAIIGFPVANSPVLNDEVTKTGLNPALRFLDGKDQTSILRCDFAIVVRQHNGNGSDGDRAIHNLGRNRVVLAEDAQPATILRHIRDICARQ